MGDLDLNSIPIRALMESTRILLGNFLNPDQKLLTKDGCARDYRGLADQMDFQHNEIRNFARFDDPTSKILEAWEINSEATIGKLIEYLEKMERYDAIEDLQSRFEENAKLFIQRKERVRERPLSVPEDSFHVQLSHPNDSNVLTCDDSYNEDYILYDAFVSYADEDMPFVNCLARNLEDNGFRLFLPTRDMLGGHFEYDAIMRIIKERCRRVLVILTPDFVKSPSCKVQASFAASLGFDERYRKIIPILLKPCEIPLILQYISKIDFTRSDYQNWVWKRLKDSLQETPSSVFTSSERRLPQGSSLPQIDSNSNNENPAITYPSSSCSLKIEACVTNVSEVVVSHETLTSSSMTVSKSSSPTNLKIKLQNFFRPTKKNGKKQDASPNLSSSSSNSSSNATSGFHSQSGNVLSAESIENSNVPCSQDAPV